MSNCFLFFLILFILCTHNNQNNPENFYLVNSLNFIGSFRIGIFFYLLFCVFPIYLFENVVLALEWCVVVVYFSFRKNLLIFVVYIFVLEESNQLPAFIHSLNYSPIKSSRHYAFDLLLLYWNGGSRRGRGGIWEEQCVVFRIWIWMQFIFKVEGFKVIYDHHFC